MIVEKRSGLSEQAKFVEKEQQGKRAVPQRLAVHDVPAFVFSAESVA